MNEIFTLENYKNYLINVYRYEIDNNETCKEKRKAYLKNFYSDEFLQKIIDDTINFIIDFIESNLDNQTHYFDVFLAEEPRYIFLNLCGGLWSDVLYELFEEESEQKIISLHLLHKFLGETFRIEEDSHIEPVIDEYDDFTIYNEYYYPFIRIAGNFQELEEKYQMLKEQKQSELINVLKRKLEKDK